MRRQRVKPNRTESKFGFLIGIAFSIFGVFMLFVAIFTPVSTVAVPFAILWTFMAMFNTYRAYKNGFTEEGMSLYEIESSDTEINQSIDFEEKLRKIDRLKKEGLISEYEYDKKREKIMKENW